MELPFRPCNSKSESSSKRHPTPLRSGEEPGVDDRLGSRVLLSLVLLLIQEMLPVPHGSLPKALLPLFDVIV